MERGFIFLILLVASTPALAQSSIKIPEPTDIALFTLAVAGLIIGRSKGKALPRDDDKNDDA
jgi:hypothetical protein